jgi:hypothetical protein
METAMVPTWLASRVPQLEKPIERRTGNEAV